MSRADLIRLRGWLVLLMTVYHVMSITWMSRPEDFWVLRFVSGAFIFMSGLAWSGQSSAHRGWRLLVLFVVLNLAIELSGVGNAEKAAWVQAQAHSPWERVLWVLWGGHPSAASFGILLPIALLLVSTSWLSRFCAAFGSRSGVWLLAAAQLVMLASGAVQASATLAWLSLGLWGMLVSLWRDRSELPCAGPTLAAPPAASRRQHLLRLSASLVGMALAVMLMTYFASHAMAYAAGTMAILACLHQWVRPSASAVAWAGWNAHLDRLGAYSLPLYILQIVMIHGLWRLGWEHRLPMAPQGLLFLGMVLFVQSVICDAWERLRARSPWANRGYRLVFG